MAKQKVKATLVSCWGNPTGALEVLRQFNNTNDQNFIRHGLSKLCCLLTPLGFNCSMSFYHNERYFCINTQCFITIADEQFAYIGNELGGDDVTAFCYRISQFISKHTADDGLFHYIYERRALA